MPSTTPTHPCCQFNFCTNPAIDASLTKCDVHRHRALCAAPDCSNQVYARGYCARHGRCTKCNVASAQANGLCVTHGGLPPPKRYCVVNGCVKQAQARQRCIQHGGGRRCTVPGCVQHVRASGRCVRHHKATAATSTQCQYAYKVCLNERAIKVNGARHSLCHDHRAKLNASQAKYNRKTRRAKVSAGPFQALMALPTVELTESYLDVSSKTMTLFQVDATHVL
ncbi:Aste57867_4762 [Aphanomyces stellatus]|uniref:Aste57867_4762 protein n=1 Tax=Aphanomyces stellatus TaxID=120398 RepID=A0A485KGW0_9STRA|nr:hypothetical protein As57867_004749 [Aphanomyces stellatus]VFT81858.1 Aste57867_4762 [Aphanomyces stellatus]